MTKAEVELLIAKYQDTVPGEFLEWGRVKNKRCGMPDVHAFLLLNEICPLRNGEDAVSSAEHDEIWLAWRATDVAEKITEDQFIELCRCGVRFDFGVDSLAMFV